MRIIDADYNQIDERGRFWLPEAMNAGVHRGEMVTLTDGELDVTARLDFDESRQVWIGEPDPASYRAAKRPALVGLV